MVERQSATSVRKQWSDRDSADRRARFGFRLHAVPPASRYRFAEYWLWRRGRRRFVSFDLRFVRPLTAVHRSEFCTASPCQGRRPCQLRLANADVLPFEFTNFADTVGQYVSEVTKLTDSMRDETKTDEPDDRQRYARSGSGPDGKTCVPKPKDDVPYLNFAPLQNAMAKLNDSAEALSRRRRSGKLLRRMHSDRSTRFFSTPNGR